MERDVERHCEQEGRTEYYVKVVAADPESL
jgi:hypothetical protein